MLCNVRHNPMELKINDTWIIKFRTGLRKWESSHVLKLKNSIPGRWNSMDSQ